MYYQLILGSVGPYGACLADGSEYTGAYLKPEKDNPLGYDKDSIRANLRDWHRDRVKRLQIGGADLLAIETIPGSLEALAILDVLEEFPGTQVRLI